MKASDFPLNVMLLLGLKREDLMASKSDITATLYYLLYSVGTNKNAQVFLLTMRDHIPYSTVSKMVNLSEGRISQINSDMIRKLRMTPGYKEMLRIGMKRYHENTNKAMQEAYRERLRNHDIHGYGGVREYNLNMYVGDLPISTKALKAMTTLGVETVGDLLNPGKFSSARVWNLYGVGAHTYNEISEFMVNSLGAKEEDWLKAKVKTIRTKNNA